jgi:hypothetical protein
MATLWALWALTGGGISTTIMMIVWLPDPPPDFTSRFFGILVAGIVGGALGGYLTHGVAFDALPGIVGAGAAGAVLSGVVAMLIPKRANAGR